MIVNFRRYFIASTVDDVCICMRHTLVTLSYEQCMEQIQIITGTEFCMVFPMWNQTRKQDVNTIRGELYIIKLP